ncbi:MAG: lipoyl(octanoyl) transferase LipB [Actinobacteria bacterium]|nr:lipoyl(octanoyl) transferase LipB [Actinomycetota bacterium]
MVGSPSVQRLAGTLRDAGSDEPVLSVDAGLVPYASAWELQRALVARRAAGQIPDVIVTLQHPPVYTTGKRADPSHVLWDAAERASRGIELHEVDRGGNVTYHGPGQLVAYPIVRLQGLRRVVAYVRALEQVCVRTAADFGVQAATIRGLTGVWVGRDKLVAIGVRVSSRGVTSHGLAFNVTTDLDHFRGIVPCGIPDRGVCSLRSLGVDADVGLVRQRMQARFAELLGCDITAGTLDGLVASPVRRAT